MRSPSSPREPTMCEPSARLGSGMPPGDCQLTADQPLRIRPWSRTPALPHCCNAAPSLSTKPAFAASYLQLDSACPFPTLLPFGSVCLDSAGCSLQTLAGDLALKDTARGTWVISRAQALVWPWKDSRASAYGFRGCWETPPAHHPRSLLLPVWSSGPEPSPGWDFNNYLMP